MSKKCGTVKNPCKICFDKVTAKTGLQCQGACRKWVHFSCLNYTPGKIQDIQKGFIKILCPCPGCDKEKTGGAPTSCSNEICPANSNPLCTFKGCNSQTGACPPCPTCPPIRKEPPPDPSPARTDPPCSAVPPPPCGLRTEPPCVVPPRPASPCPPRPEPPCPPRPAEPPCPPRPEPPCPPRPAEPPCPPRPAPPCPPRPRADKDVQNCPPKKSQSCTCAVLNPNPQQKNKIKELCPSQPTQCPWLKAGAYDKDIQSCPSQRTQSCTCAMINSHDCPPDPCEMQQTSSDDAVRGTLVQLGATVGQLAAQVEELMTQMHQCM